MLGIMLSGNTRSANVARTLDMIDTTSKMTPAPDLIVIPSGPDRSCSPQQPLSVAMAETYAASLACKAREWGVFMSFGQQRLRNGIVWEVTTVIDADADELLQHREDDSQRKTSQCAVPMGTIGVCFESQCVDPLRLNGEPAGPMDILIVQGVPQAGPALLLADAALCRRLTSETNSFVCVVRSTRQDDASSCVTFSDDALVESSIGVAGGMITTVELPGRC